MVEVRGGLVHRSTGFWSASVHDLLRHLGEVEFRGAPRFFGIDGAGREILTFLPGKAAVRPWPAHLRTDVGPRRLGAWLHRYHRAVADYRPEAARWQVFDHPMADDEVVLHGDLGPWNSIWRGSRLSGVIDWDLAHPGRPIEDLAQLAWYTVPLRDDAHAAACGFTAPPERRARLVALCDAYGWKSPADVVDMARWVMRRELEAILDQGAEGVQPWATFLAARHDADIEQTLAWLDLAGF